MTMQPSDNQLPQPPNSPPIGGQTVEPSITQPQVQAAPAGVPMQGQEVHFGLQPRVQTTPQSPTIAAPPQEPTLPPMNPVDSANANGEPAGIDDGEEFDEFDDQEEQDDTGPLLTWQSQAITGSHRSTIWYVVVGLIAAALIVTAIVLKSWFFIPLGVLVPIALTMYSSKGISAHSYELHALGILIDGKEYLYDNYSAFFEVESDGHPVIELVPVGRLGNLLTLHATEEVVDDIIEILGSVLPQSKPQGYLGESIFKRLKF